MTKNVFFVFVFAPVDADEFVAVGLSMLDVVDSFMIYSIFGCLGLRGMWYY